MGDRTFACNAKKRYLKRIVEKRDKKRLKEYNDINNRKSKN